MGCTNTAGLLTFFLGRISSQASLPPHPWLQADAPARYRHARHGRPMGLFALLVHPQLVWSQRTLPPPLGQRQWYINPTFLYTQLTSPSTYAFPPQPQANHSPTSHLGRRHNSSNPRPASPRTTTSCLWPRRRTSYSHRACISGPWRISTCACWKSMVNCPERVHHRFDINRPTWVRKREGGTRLLYSIMCFCLNEGLLRSRDADRQNIRAWN